jgi:type I restriction enzyme M protein
MDDENVRVLGKPSAIPDEYNWSSLRALDRGDLETTTADPGALGQGAGLIPVIFRKAQNKIQDPAKLERLVELIDGETWIGLDIDVKGEIYEGLLEKNAQDTKSGRRAVLHPAPADQGHGGRHAPEPGRPSATRPAARAASCWPRTITSPTHNPLDRDQWQHLRHQACTAGRSWTTPPACA